MPSAFFINPRSNPELRSLYEIIQLPQQTHLEAYFLGVMAILSEHFSVKYSALFIQDSQRNSLHLEALYGIEKGIHPSVCSGGKGTMGEVLGSRRPMAIQNLSGEPLYEEMMQTLKQPEKIQPPLLCIPLVTDDEAMGVINMDSLYGPRYEFGEDFQFLSILSTIISPAIKKYQQKKDKFFMRNSQSNLKTYPLDELLEQKLTDVLYKIDPYIETHTKLGILNDIIRVVEKILIKSALERVDHIQINAAQLLGINRNTLRKKMKELKIKAR